MFFIEYEEAPDSEVAYMGQSITLVRPALYLTHYRTQPRAMQ